MIDPTKTKPGDRVRLVSVRGRDSRVGFRVGQIVEVVDIDKLGFYATTPDIESHWWFFQSQAEPIDEPKLITKPIKDYPEWLAAVSRGMAVKCRVPGYRNQTFFGENLETTPRWIVDFDGVRFRDLDGCWWLTATPWTEAEEPDVQEERSNPMNQNGGPESDVEDIWRDVVDNPACNWPEDYAHENGNYMSMCRECGNKFVGHKRRIKCKVCADAMLEERSRT